MFKVEFSDDSGKAYAFAAFRPDQLMKLTFERTKPRESPESETGFGL